ILTDLDDAEHTAESERGEPMGRFVVSAPLICAFMNLPHKLRGELQLSGRMMNLVEDGVDVAIRIGLLADPGDIAGKVSAVRGVLGPAPADLATADTPDAPEALRDHRLIAFTGLNAQRQW
ncbi:MAG: LysR family transcriptional regulator, partial [Rhabdaerophilum sp.]